MKKTIFLYIVLIISTQLFAQTNVSLEKLPKLSATEFTTIENNLPITIAREAATRLPQQFNVLIFSGTNKARKQNMAKYLAKKVNADTYRIDLSLVVSDKISDTEKNLDLIFKTAKNKNWVLFFDEADALFGRRSSVKDGHNRYDEINYFFDLVEKYRGSVIISVASDYTINPLLFDKFVRISI